MLITHDLGVVAGLADRMMVMYAGRAVEIGAVDDLFYNPRHPYTFGLLHSTPHVENSRRAAAPIKGLPPSLEHLPTGCAFHPRCAVQNGYAACVRGRRLNDRGGQSSRGLLL